MKPSLSTNKTMPTPARGTKINCAKIIAMVVRIPSLLLPSPGPDVINMGKEEIMRIASKPCKMMLRVISSHTFMLEFQI